MKKIIACLLILLALSNILMSCNNSHKHKYSDWKVAKEATCIDSGLEERECSCGDKDTRTIPSGDHNFIDGICKNCDALSGEPTSDDYFVFTELDDGSYSIAAKDITNIPKTVVIPSSHNGKPVTVIAENAFGGKNIEIEMEYNGVMIPVVQYIVCESLTTVVIPDSVTIIDTKAFNECYNLTRVEMGNSVTHINDYAFALCAFESVDLSQSLTYIGEYAFMNHINHLILPDSLITIAPNAFNSSALVSITIPESVKEIGESAFSMCSFLREIVNNSSVEISSFLPSLLEIHSGESKIINIDNGYLFYKHEGKNLLIRYIGNETDLVLPNSINGESYEIYYQAFAGLKNIKSIAIPEGVEVINYSAFFWCESLEKAYLPKSLTTIYGVSPFGSCNVFTDVYYAGTQDDGKAITIIPEKTHANMTFTFEDVVSQAEIHYNYKPE